MSSGAHASLRAVLLTVIATTLAACTGLRGPDSSIDTDPVGELVHDGIRRSFVMHFPAQRDTSRPLPLVLALHGGGSTGRDAARLSRFNTQADRGNFLVVYPDGIDGHWNDGRDISDYRAHRDNIDDVGFLTALIDHLIEKYAVDRERVYVTGASNGAFMTNRFACERADRIAAIAPVIGSMAANIAVNCSPARAVPVLLINGTDDQLVPWDGESVRFGRRRLGKMLSVPELTRFWVRQNACADAPQIAYLSDIDPDDGTRVVRQHSTHCRDGADVVLYEVQGGGHTWPRGVQYLPRWFIGRVSQDLDANAVIWEFFTRYRRAP